MSRLLQNLLMLVGIIATAVPGFSQSQEFIAPPDNHKPADLKASTLAKPLVGSEGLQIATPLSDALAHKTWELNEQAKQNADAVAIRKAPAYGESKFDWSSILGTWIMTYDTPLTTSSPGGCSVNITRKGETNEIEIENFWYMGRKVKATVDTVAGTINIPYQYITTHGTYGNLNMGAVNRQTGGWLQKEMVVGEILSDGSIYFDTWWAVFVTSGDEAGMYLDAYCDTRFRKGNSTMEHTRMNISATNDTTYLRYEYPVITEQISSNIVKVLNFGDCGQSVEITLNPDKSAVIPTQVVYRLELNKPHMSVSHVVLNEAGTGIESYDNTININPSGSDKELKWTDWSAYCRPYRSWLGFLVDTKITFNDNLRFPAVNPVSAFDGEGTESSPYLLKTLDDLRFLSEEVNKAPFNAQSTDANGNIVEFARVYLNKYFRVANDIDMGDYRFTPIGVDGYHYFCGHIDGAGHTLRNMTIAGGSSEYASFISTLDGAGSIKNLTFDKADVKSSNVYAAVVVSDALGTISGCKVTNSSVYCSAMGAAAITGYAIKGLDNCAVENCRIYSENGYGAGLAAVSNGNITDSYAIATDISGANGSGYLYPVGGIVANYKGKVERCYYTGTIDYCPSLSYGPVYMGGIAGVPTVGSEINDCFAAAALVNARHNVACTGGLVGKGVVNITNSHFRGHIDSPISSYTGGLCGMVQSAVDSDNNSILSSFRNCYSVLTMNAAKAEGQTQQEAIGASDPAKRPVIENVCFDNQISNLGGEFGLKTSAMTSEAGIKGFDAAHWTFTAGAYPRVKALASTAAAELAASALIMPEHVSLDKVVTDVAFSPLGSTRLGLLVDGKVTDKGLFSRVEGNTLKLNDEMKFGRDSLVVYNGDIRVCNPGMMLPLPMQGKGSESEPYLMKTKGDVLALAAMTSGARLSFPGMYFKMMNDIDMEYEKDFRGLSSTHTINAKFNSVFDGNGYTIHNMAIDSLTWIIRPEDDPAGIGKISNAADAFNETYAGFIGVLGETGVLKNLTIASDCRFKVFASCGPLVGWNYGLIENCRNDADIWGVSMWQGGIAGQNLNTGVIRNCLNTGNLLNGNRQVGGISSRNNGLIENCINTGSVEVVAGAYQAAGSNNLTYAGGIAGSQSGGRISNSQNFGDIKTLEGIAGGLVGENSTTSSSSAKYTNDLVGCSSFGVVTSGDILTTGQLIGKGGTTGEVSSVYDYQVPGTGAIANGSANGLNGVATKDLVSGNAIASLDVAYYDFKAGRYPVLKLFANDPVVTNAASMAAVFADGDIASNVTKNAGLTQKEGLVWTLAQGKDFHISGNTLEMPASIAALVNDTLTATFGKLKKSIPLMIIPAVPMAGEGTEQDPYLIKNAEDWNNVAAFMAATDNSFEGKFIKLADDIDFTGKEFKPIGVSPTFMNATFDGANHTMKGIDYQGEGQYVGTFGVIGSTATVKNLTLEGKISNKVPEGAAVSYASYLGAFAGKLYGKIENCVNRMEVTSEKNYVAGFVGEAYDGASFTKCINRGPVTAGGYIGGILANGKAAGGKLSFTDCSNEGNLLSTSTSSSYAGYTGGIASKTAEANFIRCTNTGKLEAVEIARANYIAGIVAFVSGTKGNPYCVFEDCVNTADIKANAGAAGIVANTSTTAGANRLQMTGCVNKGNMEVISTSSSSKSVGGLMLMLPAGSMIMDCHNEGDVTSVKASGVGGISGTVASTPTADYKTYIIGCWNEGNITSQTDMTAGIIGTLQAYTYINECYNLGNVTSLSRAAGIASNNYGANGEINDCFNLGDITVSSFRAGGILAYAQSNAGADTKINNCWNAGTVRTTCTTLGVGVTAANPSGFGIGGIAAHTKAQLTNCVNFGEVIGADAVGGLVGLAYAGTKATVPNTSLTNCYNVGKVTVQPGGHASNTVVKASLATGTGYGGWNDEFNVFKDVRYATDFGTFDGDCGEGMKLADIAKADFGTDWTSADNASLPLPKDHYDWEAARLHSATVVLSDGDDHGNVTKPFKVGNPAGIKWTASAEALVIEGNDATWKDKFTGDVQLTATIGKFSKTVTVKANVTTSGIENVVPVDGKTVVGEAYFTPDGLQVAKPTAADGRTYIVVFTYADGSASTVKLLNN